MTGRRSKFEIYINILEEINGGTNIPTKIMYATNLSWKPLQQILLSLLAQELIVEHRTEDGDKRTKKFYELTEKGINVLRYFVKAKELVEGGKIVEINNWR